MWKIDGVEMTTEQPTEAGLYWSKYPDDKKATVVRWTKNQHFVVDRLWGPRLTEPVEVPEPLTCRCGGTRHVQAFKSSSYSWIVCVDCGRKGKNANDESDARQSWKDDQGTDKAALLEWLEPHGLSQAWLEYEHKIKETP